MKIIKIPSSLGNLEKLGCEKAPDEIIEQLKGIWLDENFKVEKIDLEDIKDFDKKFKDGDIFLGGDHSLSYYLFKKTMNKDDGIIIFDAHPDVFESFKFPTYEDWLFHLIKNGYVKKENVILIGLRNCHKKEIEFLKEKMIRFYTLKQLNDNIEEICDSIMEIARDFKNLYLSVDIDVVDPAFAPGVNYTEPGGLTSRELIYFIQRLKLLKNLEKVDIVEVNPNLDINKMTSKLAAKLVAELIV